MDAPTESIKARIARLQLDHLTKPKPPKRIPGNEYQSRHERIGSGDLPGPSLNGGYKLEKRLDSSRSSNNGFSSAQQRQQPRISVKTTSLLAQFVQSNQPIKYDSGKRNNISVSSVSSVSVLQFREIKNSAPPKAPVNYVPPLNFPLTPAVNTLLSRSKPEQKSTSDVPPKSPSYSNSTGLCFECVDYSGADSQGEKFPRHSVNSISSLAQNLTSPFQNPVLKARVIFTWLHHNIAYDAKSYLGGNVTYKSPEETLRSGLAVCQGYAELFEQLGRHGGLEVMVISGHGKGYSHRIPTGSTIPPFSSNHAWNAVKLQGKWKLIDSCWGAGHINDQGRYEKSFKPKHFTSSPEAFRLRHFPTEAKHQFCPDVISWKDYILMKEGPTIFTGFSAMGFNDVELTPNIKRIPSGHPTKFQVKTRCPHLHIKPEDRYILLMTVNRNTSTPLEMEVEGSVWSIVMPPLSSGTIQLNYVNTLGSRNGKGITVEEYEASKTRLGMSWTGMAQWEVY